MRRSRWCPPSPSEAQIAPEPYPPRSCHRTENPENNNGEDGGDGGGDGGGRDGCGGDGGGGDGGGEVGGGDYHDKAIRMMLMKMMMVILVKNLVNDMDNVQWPDKENATLIGRVRRHL